ncbi:MAG: type II toxin-antitoxin system RatA family toxin [Hyphomonadaceae bacterium]
MTIVEAERRLPYPPEALRDLVGDVRAYPTFIPWMLSLAVLSESVHGGVRELTARAVVGWRALREEFTSRVRIGADTVDVALVDGPFRVLENAWRFTPDGAGGAVVRFRVAYEFKSPLLQALASFNRERAADKIMQAFEAEAKRRFAA